MSTINTNLSSLIAQRVLRRNNNNLSLARLSTGLKINRGANNPAGLIASENLRAKKVRLAKAISNAERASNVIGTADDGLSEVSSLLNELQGLFNEAANSGGLSAEEIAANQLQVDSILNTINRVAQSTSFQGTKLLNGNRAYTTSGVGSNFANVRVNAARLPDGASMSVVASVTQSASLGDATIGALSTLASGQANALTGDNLVTAQKILDRAVKQVSQLRGRLGAFQKLTIGSTINALGVALENANAAESAIHDTDFAEETAKLTRSDPGRHGGPGAGQRKPSGRPLAASVRTVARGYMRLVRD